MKQFIITLLILSHIPFSNAQIHSLNDIILKSDSLNFVTLVVDYDTFEFEGGNISYYEPCNNCTEDSIPFEVLVNYPGDFGDITFSIQNTLETAFFATIIWMGTGEIYHPESFSATYPFNNIGNKVEKPDNIEYYDKYGTKVYNDSSFINSADSAWYKIDSLEITKLFSENNYKAAIFLYPPSVGIFSPEAAKWIIFFYLEDFNAAIQPIFANNDRLRIYPNPCKDFLTIDKLPKKSKFYSLEIMDLSGRTMINKQIESIQKESIDIKRFNSGVYLLRIYNNNSTYHSLFVKD